MHLKLSITLLSFLACTVLVLTTSTDALYCDDSASGNVKYDSLIGNRWYIQNTDDPDYVGKCISFKFDYSTKHDNDLIVTTYAVGKDGEKAFNSTFMQYISPAQYSLWNTGDPDFDPLQPGDVDEIGKATFTTFIAIPFNVASAFVLKTCYQSETKYESSAISGRFLPENVIKRIQIALYNSHKILPEILPCSNLV